MKTISLILLISVLVAAEAQTLNRGTYKYEFRSGNRRINDHSSKVPLNQQFYNGNGKTDRPLQKRPGGVPPYAVLMEPLVHYSQPDPLYVQDKLNVSAVPYETRNDLIKKAYVNEESKDSYAQSQVTSKSGTQSSYGDSAASSAQWIAGHIIHPRRKPKPRPTPPPPPPEPIIEIIIKESNISLPAPPPPPPPPPKKKEPVHVFFVKYSKDPNANYGEEKLIYEPPVPAVTPPTNIEDPNEQEHQYEEEAPYPDAPYPESATYEPPPSTTLKAIIKPESEIYHGTGGLQITFGGPEPDEDGGYPPSQGHNGNGYPPSPGHNGYPPSQGGNGNGYPPSPGHNGNYYQQSAPQPAVAFPHKSSGISRASTDSQPTKRNPEPFNPSTSNTKQAFPSSARPTQSPFVSSQEFQRPTAPPTFQQAPQFPAQIFHKSLQSFNNFKNLQAQPTVNIPRPQSTQTYSTLPQSILQNAQPGHHHFGPSRAPPVQSTAQSAQQYHTINDQHLRQNFQNNVRPTPSQQYHTINQHTLQTNNYRTVPSSTNRFPQPTNVTPSNPFHQRNQQRPFENRPQVSFQEQSRPQQSHFSFQQQHQTQPQFNQFHSQQQQVNHQTHQKPVQQNQQFQQQKFQQQQQQQQNQNFQSNSGPEIIKSISPDISFPDLQKTGFPTAKPSFSNQQPAFPTPQAAFPKPQPAFLPTVNPAVKFSTQRPPFQQTSKPVITYRTTTQTKIYAQTTPPPIEYVTEDPKKLEEERRKKEERRKQNVAALPKEVPEDLRQQLLNSGILGNADIQILDYDKIGDIPIESLPPEALANFQQVAAGSAPIPAVAQPDKETEDAVASASENQEVTVASGRNAADGMEMKVVRFNPESKEGINVASNYMKDGATQLDPVVLNDSKYNRYLPLKVSGAQFPVPDVPELRGRNVTSVVVLAPVDYEFLQRRENYPDSISRSAGPVLEVQGVHFIAGDTLKTLVKVPTTENYKRWLDKENNTAADKQSVVLLVFEPVNSSEPETKDIYMYDISTQRVSKLKGELSSTFVEVAESNSQNEDLEEISDSPSAPGGDFTIKDTSGITSSIHRVQRKAKAIHNKTPSTSR